MKVIVAIALALVVAIGGWVGWNKYQSGQETKAAAQSVQAASTKTERQLNARKEDGITFAEYFKRESLVMDDLDQEISGLQAREWGYAPGDRDSAIAFIEQCKAILRSDQAEARLMLEEQNAKNAVDSAKKDLDEANSSASTEWALKRYDRASQDRIEVLNNLIKNAKESKGKIEKLLASDEAVKSRFGQEVGLSDGMIKEYKKQISSEKAEPEKPAEG